MGDVDLGAGGNGEGNGGRDVGNARIELDAQAFVATFPWPQTSANDAAAVRRQEREQVFAGYKFGETEISLIVGHGLAVRLKLVPAVAHLPALGADGQAKRRAFCVFYFAVDDAFWRELDDGGRAG